MICYRCPTFCFPYGRYLVDVCSCGDLFVSRQSLFYGRKGGVMDGHEHGVRKRKYALAELILAQMGIRIPVAM